GRLGNAGERRAPLTASALTSPDLANGTSELRLSNIMSTWPAIRSVVALAPPRYGTCTMLVLVITLNSSPPTWPGEPLADDALVSLPGFLRAASITSCTDLNGDWGATANNRCPCVASMIGWKSRSTS